jgi:DNA mismatch repair protein MutS
VFDLGSGQFRSGDPGGSDDPAASGDGQGPTATAADGSGDDSVDELRETYGEAAGDVLDALADLDVSETPPVELMSRVQEWQRDLE